MPESPKLKIWSVTQHGIESVTVPILELWANWFKVVVGPRNCTTVGPYVSVSPPSVSNVKLFVSSVT